MMTDDQVFLQHLRARLTQQPNQHIAGQVLARLPGMPAYSGFSFNNLFDVAIFPFLQLEGVKIEKISLGAAISLFDECGKHFNEEFTDVRLEFFLVTEDGNYNSDGWLLLSLDDLLFYVNRYRNRQAITEFNFPKLSSCELGTTGFDFIMRGRLFRNQYFEKYKGPVFDTYYGDEFNELFAIAANALAFLYRSRDRVMEELDLSQNYNYRSSLDLYPRFNNGVAEVAGTIYAAWERVAFLFHEFFPLNPNSNMAPSFKSYILGKVKEANKDNRWQNADLDWFKARIDGPHVELENLRHPTVHYNKSRTPSGTRAVELMKSSLDQQVISKTKKDWQRELEFLRMELAVLNISLEHAIGLLEKWAVTLALPLNLPVNP
jgi:hypothetical protein